MKDNNTELKLKTFKNNLLQHLFIKDYKKQPVFGEF